MLRSGAKAICNDCQSDCCGSADAVKAMHQQRAPHVDARELEGLGDLMSGRDPDAKRVVVDVLECENKMTRMRKA
jgi:hypothetical protein